MSNNKFEDVFSSDKVGTLPGKVYLKVDPDATPHIGATRRIPVALSSKVEDELNRSD